MFARFAAVSVFGLEAMYAPREVPAVALTSGVVNALSGAGAAVFGKLVVLVTTADSNWSVGVAAFGVATRRKALVSPERPAPEAAANATIGLSLRLPPVMTAPLALYRVMLPIALGSGSKPGVTAACATPPPTRTLAATARRGTSP